MKTDKAFLIFSWTVFGVFLLYRLLVIVYPHPDAGGVEGNVIYFIQRILNGETLYTDPAQAPYSIAQYTPLYYYLVAAFARICSIGPDDVLQLFILSRTISLSLNLVFVFIVYGMARYIFAADKAAGIVAGIICFIFLEITSFSRPDSLYHVFFLASLFFLLRLIQDTDNKKNTGLILSCCLGCALSFFSKQTGIILPVIAGLWFLWKRQYHILVKFSLFYLLFLATGLFFMHQLFGMDVFYRNIVLGVANGVKPGWFFSMVIPSFHNSFGMVFMIIALALWFILKRKPGSLSQFSGFFLVFLFVSMNLAVLKYGSGAGYFTEWVAFVVILSAASLPGYLNKFEGLQKRIPVLMLSAFMLLKSLTLLWLFYQMLAASPYSARFASYQKQKEIAVRISSQLTAGNRYVVFLNLYTPDSYLSNLLFRHAVIPQMDIVALASYPQARYDYSTFDRQLEDGTFKWMIMKENSKKQFYGRNLDNYIPAENMNGYSIYQFKAQTP